MSPARAAPRTLAVRPARRAEVEIVSSILGEAAAWLARRGMALWEPWELEPARIASEVEAGLFFLAWCGGEAAGTLRYEHEDPCFWPEAAPGEAAYLHRLAVRRRHAGGGVSAALLAWARERARAEGRAFLRLDCETHRGALRAFYERQGFRHHSDRRVGAWHVARYELRLGASSPP